MNYTHRDSVIHDVFKDMEHVLATKMRIENDGVILQTKTLYCAYRGWDTIKSEDPTIRCSNHKGIQVACAYFACKVMNIPRTRAEFERAFAVSYTNLSKACVEILQMVDERPQFKGIRAKMHEDVEASELVVPYVKLLIFDESYKAKFKTEHEAHWAIVKEVRRLEAVMLQEREEAWSNYQARTQQAALIFEVCSRQKLRVMDPMDGEFKNVNVKMMSRLYQGASNIAEVRRLMREVDARLYPDTEGGQRVASPQRRDGPPEKRLKVVHA